jgi:hypothetical protein
MTFSRTRVSYILPLALAAGVAMLPAGCGGEPGVTSYDVPKTTDPSKKIAAPAAGGDYRLLGAMFPADEPEWFFKFSAPSAEMAKYEADFDELLKSVKLEAGKPDFTVPKGWTKGPGRAGIVVATAVTPDGKYEVTLTSSSGGVKANLDRWVGQIGLRPSPTDVATYTKPLATTSGVKGLRVDMSGPNNPATKRGGPMMPPGHP